MSAGRAVVRDVVAAFQFLTRLPTPAIAFDSGTLARAVKYFPLVGLMVGLGAAELYRILLPHLAQPVVAWVIVLYLVLITGCFHEDALADVADSFGAWTRERRLAIMRDSRIGSYGAAALVLSIVGRLLLLRALPLERFTAYVIVAQVLCRWSTLPLSYLLPAARTADAGNTEAGQGAQIARLTSQSSLLFGSIFSVAVTVIALRWASIAPLLAVCAVTAASGRLFMRRLGGVTGDCFGATNQVAEIAVYLCGVWMA
ncbi:MAG TPA: adenosylcobinamide-GDP ribazoletransferase [Granulicella sp.]|nr:adenosylcobinamide-GDP ribazoletransferase [Granulicella sp.]